MQSQEYLCKHSSQALCEPTPAHHGIRINSVIIQIFRWLQKESYFKENWKGKKQKKKKKKKPKKKQKYKKNNIYK